jgi:hypothetical protein
MTNCSIGKIFEHNEKNESKFIYHALFCNRN